ncbi:unnamed protein product [Allacma fusca]|uniref:DUF1736 domain-containing protein n=1 Tax=Allacma fusca TaxID=39272 RepID=A0A8J2KZD9_9HEXA|nr:unnamed protein product [Allacma fusca]
MKKSKILLLFFLGVTSVSPTLWGTFIFDDGEAIVKNEDVINPSSESFWKIFKDDFWGVSITHPQSHKSFRPLTTLSFRLNYLAWGKDAFRFHLLNLVIHGVNCVLVYYFLKKCFNNSSKYDQVCYYASVIFAVHPIHVEPLGGLVGRADIIAALVFMGAFILTPSDHCFCSSIFIATFSILGSLFKENAIVAVLLYITLDIIVRRGWKPSKLQVFYHVLSLGLVLGFIVLRLWYQGGAPVFQPFDNPPAFAKNKFAKVVSILYIWLLNVFLLIHPMWLCYDWSMGCVNLIRTPFDFRFFLVVIFVAVGIRLVFLAFNSKIIMVALLISATTFLPSSNLIFTVGFVLAERNLYLPCAGYALFISYAFQKRGNVKLIIFIVMWFYVRSVQRSVQWIDEGLLFKSALRVCPGNAKIHYNLGTFYGESGRKMMAADAYRTALKLKPDYYQSMNNLGNLLRSSEAYEEAELWLRKAVSTKPDFAAAWMNLGIVLSRKNTTEAMDCYFKALEHRRRYPDCEYNLGNLYLDVGDKERAIKSWIKAVSLKPTHTQAWVNLIILMDQDGKIQDAKEWATKASKILTSDDTIQFLMGNIFGKLSEFAEAENYFKTAIGLRQKSNRLVPAKYFANLGVLYHRWNKYSLAKSAYEEALKIDPQLESVHKNLGNLLKKDSKN